MTRRVADHYPRRNNMYVPNMDYHAEVDGTNDNYKCNLRGKNRAIGSASTNLIFAAVSIAVAGTSTALAAAYTTRDDDVFGRYGRALSVVASGAATGDVIIRGFDYLGQPMSERFALNGTTAVNGKKAFRTVVSMSYPSVAGVTVDVGTINVFGLPYMTQAIERELVDGAVPANAGTFVAPVLTQTATSGDPRGTWAPHTSVAPNGSRIFEILGYAAPGNLHGPAHFYE